MRPVEPGFERYRRRAARLGWHRFVAWAVAMALTASSVPAPIAAQVSPGVQGSWASDSDLGLGVRVAVGLHGLLKGLEAAGIFDYYFPGEGAAVNVADWEASANLLYRVEIGGRLLRPYAGAGMGVARYTATVRALGADLEGSETRSGLNLLGGLVFDVGRAMPFLETRVTLGGSEQLALTAGLRF